jgi:pilus assembly protein CpaB
MNTRAFTLALIVSIIAMLMVNTYIDDQEAQIKQRFGKEVTVLVAKSDIQELELIDDSKIMKISIPERFRSPGYFSDEKELANTIATMPILKGEQLTKPRVTYPGIKTGLSRQISLGKRAISIQVSDREGVSKLLKPGDRVDILAAIDYGSGRKDMQKLKTILQDVLVLSTGQSITNSIPIIGVQTPQVIKQMNLNTYVDYNTITLELDPFQSQQLIFYLSYFNARPYLSLRNNSDKEIVRIKSTRIFDILGDDAPEAKAYFSDKYAEEAKGAK